jgi:hypothetical protein
VRLWRLQRLSAITGPLGVPEPPVLLPRVNDGKESPVTNADRVTATAADMLTRDFLAWLDSAPRTYAEVMAGWRTSCPRFSIWEDALADDLIRIESAGGKPVAQAEITLTERVQAALASIATVQDASVVGS